MPETKTYRQYAADCRRLAKTMNQKDGAILLKMAEAWDMRADDVEKTFWVALDWGNYRLLTDYAGLSADAYQQWILDYYFRMFDLGEVMPRPRPPAPPPCD